MDLSFDNLVGTDVGHPEHQTRHTVAHRDDCSARKTNACTGPREFREDQPGDQRKGEQSSYRLDTHDDVGNEALRRHPAVADGGHGLYAEEKGVSKRSGTGILDPAAE